MQAAAVAKITSKSHAGSGHAASAASDLAATDGVDFAALLAAQFQEGGVGADAEPVLVDSAVQDLKSDVVATALKADAVPDAKAEAVVDPALQPMTLMPGFAPLMQQIAPETRPVSARIDKLSGDKPLAVLPGVTDAELKTASDKMPLLAKEGAAEFAVDGKSLPSGDGDAKPVETKTADAFKLPVFSVDAQRVPDTQRTPDAMPTIIGPNQVQVAGEIKTPAGGVQPPVGASGWGDAFGQKVVWMAGQQQQVAELHLNPPHLGPMEVRLTISNDQVSALFVSHQPAVREAIEAAMPRLREMFADSGMMLGNAMVSSDSLPQHQNPGQERQSGTSGSRSDFPLMDGYSSPLTTRGVIPLHGDGSGMVDLFA